MFDDDAWTIYTRSVRVCVREIGRWPLEKPRVHVPHRGWLALMGMLLLWSPVQAYPFPDSVELVRRKARELQSQSRWAQALELYVRIPRSERTPEDRDRYQICVRRLLQSQRLRDKSSHILLSRIRPAEAEASYREAIDTLHRKYVDRDKISLSRIFLDGVQELRSALDDDLFLREYLPDVNEETTNRFKDYLDALLGSRPTIRTVNEARDQFRDVQQKSQPMRLKPGFVLVEFLCGACQSLDEYSLYLGPRQLGDAEADRDGKVIGTGLEAAFVDQKLVVTRVHRNSPADSEGIRPGDWIVSIDGQPVDGTMMANTLGRLVGEEGTFVDLEVARSVSDGTLVMTTFATRLARRPFTLTTVDPGEELRDGMRDTSGIGYLKISAFQKSTPHELKEAIIDLSARLGGMKGLVVDLRGNPGGWFPAALQVAELFLQEGIIAYSQGRTREEVHRANNPGAFTMPLVVLVDGDTASAAEVVAGALKERGRAVLIGQTTFGKNLMQEVFRLKNLNAGLQLTIARICTPDHACFEGRGVVPHHVVEGNPLPTAFQTATQMVKMIPR